MWTEILNEKIGVTHIHDQMIVWPLGEDVKEYEIEVAMKELRRRRVRKQLEEQFRADVEAMKRDMERRETARQRLVEAGYDSDEIPL